MVPAVSGGTGNPNGDRPPNEHDVAIARAEAKTRRTEARWKAAPSIAKVTGAVVTAVGGWAVVPTVMFVLFMAATTVLLAALSVKYWSDRTKKRTQRERITTLERDNDHLRQVIATLTEGDTKGSD